MSGPSNGLRFVEFAGIGPGPMAATLLSDLGALLSGLGAEVIRIDRMTASGIVIESRHRHYNTERPHGSLAYGPPASEVFVPAFAAWASAGNAASILATQIASALLK